MFAWLGAGTDTTDAADATAQSENRNPSSAAANNSSSSSSSSSSALRKAGTAPDDAFAEPECDYDRSPTQLYRLIESKRWDAAVVRAQSCPEEAATWVCRREKGAQQQQQQQQGLINTGVRWRLLPIHATCVFRSPLSLIEALIEAYPDGPQMKDVSALHYNYTTLHCLAWLGLASLGSALDLCGRCFMVYFYT